MHRTLRVQILAIVVGAIAVAVGLARWTGAADAERTSAASFLGFFAFAAALGGFALLLDRFLRARLQVPIETLNGVMAAATAGRFEAPAPRQASTELDSLAASLNAMLDRTRAMTHGLEERVGRTTDELATRARELETLNEHLRAMQLEAVRSERFAALGQTMATLAHELGTPLNSVLGYTQLLRQQEAEPERSAKLDVIESQVRRMIETIDRTLTRTREGVLEVENVDVRRIVDEVLTLVSARAEKQGIEIAPEIAREPTDVRADPAALRQVLVNLVNNALDADDTRRVVIRIATPPGALATGNLEIEVSDDGAGIPQDEQPRVFEAFYTTKEPGRGTGLGLAIVDHLVRAHGGEISVESAPARGTVFRVRLPCGSAS